MHEFCGLSLHELHKLQIKVHKKGRKKGGPKEIILEG